MDAYIEPLRHGSAQKRSSGGPRLGERYQTKTVAIDLIPARSYEVHFKAPEDVISISMGVIRGHKSHDSDVLSPLEIDQNSMHWHPAESAVFEMGEENTSECVSFTLDPSLRSQLADEFGVSNTRFDQGVRENMKTHSARMLANSARRFILSGHGGGRMAAESLGVLALAAALEAMLQSDSRLATPSGCLDPSRLDLVLDVIEETLDGELGLVRLAELVDLTPFHFARSFKAATGVSPHQYVLERRVIRAREKLETEAASLADIAYAVGFSSQAHMTDVFRKRIGVTPGQYRKNRLASRLSAQISRSSCP